MDPAAPARPPRKRAITRVIAVVVVWLVVGIATNVAAAWAIAAWVPHRGWERAEVVGSDDGAALWLYIFRTRGAVRRAWNWEIPGLGRVMPNSHNAIRSSRPIDISSAAALSGPLWGQALAVRARARNFTQDGAEQAVGWPALCLWCTFRSEGYGWVVGNNGLPLTGLTGLAHIRGLPLQLIWPGFALNSLFYAAIAWGLWRIPILVRRHRRRTRGLCLKCAYNRAGLAPGAACPECGQVPGPGASVASV